MSQEQTLTNNQILKVPSKISRGEKKTSTDIMKKLQNKKANRIS